MLRCGQGLRQEEDVTLNLSSSCSAICCRSERLVRLCIRVSTFLIFCLSCSFSLSLSLSSPVMSWKFDSDRVDEPDFDCFAEIADGTWVEERDDDKI